MRKLSYDELDLLVGILRGYSINALSDESDIPASTIDHALLGQEIPDSDARAIAEMIYEYSQE